ncbi:proteoglycan 4-like [Bacillus rossius redtenbacheri]|uniref:proteoglycan 4-like n=1 Tax=Bacillus rossius redtenbacheri TaxID=93214 RepID=UPI002FDEE521
MSDEMGVATRPGEEENASSSNQEDGQTPQTPTPTPTPTAPLPQLCPGPRTVSRLPRPKAGSCTALHELRGRGGSLEPGPRTAKSSLPATPGSRDSRIRTSLSATPGSGDPKAKTLSTTPRSPFKTSLSATPGKKHERSPLKTSLSATPGSSDPKTKTTKSSLPARVSVARSPAPKTPRTPPTGRDPRASGSMDSLLTSGGLRRTFSRLGWTPPPPRARGPPRGEASAGLDWTFCRRYRDVAVGDWDAARAHRRVSGFAALLRDSCADCELGRNLLALVHPTEAPHPEVLGRVCVAIGSFLRLHGGHPPSPGGHAFS